MAHSQLYYNQRLPNKGNKSLYKRREGNRLGDPHFRIPVQFEIRRFFGGKKNLKHIDFNPVHTDV